MRRREWIALLGGIIAIGPRALAAQQGCCHVIGVLAPNPKVFADANAGRDLATLGWQPERDVRLLFRWGAGSNEELPALAACRLIRRLLSSRALTARRYGQPERP